MGLEDVLDEPTWLNVAERCNPTQPGFDSFSCNAPTLGVPCQASLLQISLVAKNHFSAFDFQLPGLCRDVDAKVRFMDGRCASQHGLELGN